MHIKLCIGYFYRTRWTA